MARIESKMGIVGMKSSRRGVLGLFAAAPLALKEGVGAVAQELQAPANLMGDVIEKATRTIGSVTEACADASDSESEWLSGKKLLETVLGRNYQLPHWKRRMIENNARYKAVYNGITPEINQLKSINIHTKRRMQMRAYIKEAHQEVIDEIILDEERDNWYERMRKTISFRRFL